MLFKSIQVGRIENVELTAAGDVAIDAFINAPYHLRLTEGTRFWNASGFSIEIGAGGASLNVDSLISLLQGGVSFDTVGSDTAPIEAGHVYDLYPSEAAARQNFFDEAPGERVLIDTLFEGSVGGLQPGAAVRFRGLQVGEVEALQAAIVDDAGRPQVSLRATLAISPSRIGVPDDAPDPAAATLDALETQVALGLRARLATTGLIAQSLQVELVEVPDAPPAALNLEAQPNPVIPSVPADLSSVATSVEGVLKRVSDLPLEQVVQNAAELLGNLNALVTDDRVRSAPENLGALLADLRTMLDSSGIKQAPAELSALLASARQIVDQAVQAQARRRPRGDARGRPRRGRAASRAPPKASRSSSPRSRRSPVRCRRCPSTRSSRPARASSATSRRSCRAPRSPTSRPRSTPRSRSCARCIEAIRTGGAVDNLNATLASTRRVSDEIAAADLAQRLDSLIQEVQIAAGNVGTASADLPELMDNLNALSGRVETLPLDELVTSATQVVQTADRLLASEGMAEVPPNLAAALDELRALLADLREGGAVNNLNATLASADSAASAVENAANELPALVANLNRVAAEAERALASVSPGSDINRDTQRLLQEVRDAARSINALALALERRPNSVLFGR